MKRRIYIKAVNDPYFCSLPTLFSQRISLLTISPVFFTTVDLFENTNVCTKLYADDIKIYLEISCDTDTDTDHTTLQDSINKIYSWSKTWQLKLASNKCQHNRITLSTDVSTSDDYSLSDVLLPTVNDVRDLGVLVDSRLTFRDHINSVVSRGHIRAMQIWRCFLCKDVSNLIRA